MDIMRRVKKAKENRLQERGERKQEKGERLECMGVKRGCREKIIKPEMERKWFSEGGEKR